MKMGLKYLSLGEHQDLEYFIDLDIYVSEEKRNHIKPLTKTSTNQFWVKHISRNNDRPMLLNEIRV